MKRGGQLKGWMSVSPSTAGGSDKHEIGLSIGTFPASADECLTGLIPQDFKIRLQIFITWLRKKEREKKGGKWKWTERMKNRSTNLQANPTEIGFAQLLACHSILYVQAGKWLVNNGKLFQCTKMTYIQLDNCGWLIDRGSREEWEMKQQQALMENQGELQ